MWQAHKHDFETNYFNLLNREIMFHVSTLLPTDPEDKQQVTIQFNIPKTNKANYVLTISD